MLEKAVSIHSLNSGGRKNPSTRKTLTKFLWRSPRISRKQSGKRKKYKLLSITSVRTINRERYWHHFSEIQCTFRSSRPKVYLKIYFQELLQNLHLHRRSLFISSRLEVFIVTGVLKICSKFTGKHPC